MMVASLSYPEDAATVRAAQDKGGSISVLKIRKSCSYTIYIHLLGAFMSVTDLCPPNEALLLQLRLLLECLVVPAPHPFELIILSFWALNAHPDLRYHLHADSLAKF